GWSRRREAAPVHRRAGPIAGAIPCRLIGRGGCRENDVVAAQSIETGNEIILFVSAGEGKLGDHVAGAIFDRQYMGAGIVTQRSNIVDAEQPDAIVSVEPHNRRLEIIDYWMICRDGELQDS